LGNASPAETLLFLPGALGRTEIWQPVAQRLQHPGARRFVRWPGFGDCPADPRIDRLDDLAARVADEIDGPVDILAQSMGGVVAVLATLTRPAHVRHLVLSVTSGGIDTAAFGAEDWRRSLSSNHPELPRWFVDDRRDLTHRLREIAIPVLLLWGDADPISPVAVGERLHELLPSAELIVVPGGTHDLVSERAADIAPRIDRHLQLSPGSPDEVVNR
jgi:pimeloyl-ACP methyl ester carboxylesterase